MPECLERAEIASWTTTEVQQSEWRWNGDVRQEHLDVLAHIVIARAFPIPLGIPVVVRQRAGRDLTQIFRGLWHPNHSIRVRIPGLPLEDGYLDEWAFLSAKRDTLPPAGQSRPGIESRGDDYAALRVSRISLACRRPRFLSAKMAGKCWARGRALPSSQL